MQERDEKAEPQTWAGSAASSGFSDGMGPCDQIQGLVCQTVPALLIRTGLRKHTANTNVFMIR